MNISITQLAENDWRLLSEIRLRALQTDPSVFGSNYESESKFTEAEWRSRLQSDDSAIFMIFDGETPIGMTGVSVFRDDPSGRTAMLWGSWLAPEFRQKGLSDLMYEKRIEWAKAHPTVERIIVSNRASNLASKYANQKHGFVFTRTHEKIWTDGKLEDEVCYELKLKS
ncbi:MAG TPA: GNAT family protein [Pyrinomonadaceae bacterium]|nr:GNAT family protein [Pyrinomonadaceae bacterium]